MSQLKTVLSRALILVALMAAALPAESQARDIPQLSRRTVVEGSRSFQTEFQVTKPVRLDARLRPTGKPTPEARIQGGGRFSGVIVLKEDEGGLHDVFMVGRWRCSSQRVCGSHHVNVVYPPGKDDVRLDAGNYRLVFIADQSPTRVVLHMPQLDGNEHIDGGQPAQVDIRDPQTRVTMDQAGQHIYSNGSHYAASGAGLALTMWAFRTKSPLDLELHECVYTDNPPPDEVAYGPQCDLLNATGAGSTWKVQRRNSRPFIMTVSSLWDIPSGNAPDLTHERGYGLWFRSNVVLDAFDSGGLFLSY